MEKILKKELGKKFEKVIEDDGVFKQTEEGMKEFKRFIDVLNG